MNPAGQTAKASAVAPISASKPTRETDMLVPDTDHQDSNHGACWALKQGMKKEFVFTNCNAWAEGAFLLEGSLLRLAGNLLRPVLRIHPHLWLRDVLHGTHQGQRRHPYTPGRDP